jgi:dihydropteroate synthase
MSESTRRELREEHPQAAEGGRGRTATIMGILNVTPDSFSDGGRYLATQAAIAHGLELAAQGAAIIDVGGESTRPGSEPIGVEQERRRVLPVIEGLLAGGVRAEISIDTSKATVALAALDAGATVVNDVTALRADPGVAALIAERGAGCCLVHMQGEPRTMQLAPSYGDVVAEVIEFLGERVDAATAAGIARERIMVDPGIGFGKTVEHNLELLARLGELSVLGLPIAIGTSRKSFLGRLTGRGEEERLAATIATNVIALLAGASVFRVHDVAPLRDALAVAAATVSHR